MIDYDKLALEYAQHRRVHPDVLQALISTGEVGRSTRVLEVGCGTGNYITALTALTGCPGWGLDPSFQMLNRAGEQAAEAGATGINLLSGRAERLPFPLASFDLVFSVDVIHHVTDRAGYFRAAHRILKPGGKLCTVTDSEWIISQRRPLATCFPETVAVDLGRYPSVADLRRSLAQAGFQQIFEHTVALTYPFSDIQMIRAKAFSVLHLISEAAFQRGLAALERDVDRGPIEAVSRYLLLWARK
ncbi:MAG TPA: methyltransferase domain-containing protein [Anaerolineae bacterium]|jgi:ubiquinone/menaquinone biosynthesis C-methylase UbiE